MVITEANSSILEAAHVLNLTMVLIPVTAIVIVLVLFRRERDTPSSRRKLALSDPD